ncbi:MAG: tetratricopeptide repeat protein [Gammaproteobacteria bacterium]|nr:tetratricopeptide repeat protein [Gammaproteobacteria bacterium]
MMLIKLIAIIAGMTVMSVSFAQNSLQNSDKIKQILLNAKFKELDIDVDQKTLEQRDADSIQYKIGYKDGYQRAVTDAQNSFSQALAAPASIVANSTGTAQQWVKKSFNKLTHEGDWKEGIEAATVAISLNPNDATPYINRAWGYAEQGLLDDAIKDTNRAIALSPRNPLAYNNRGYAYELAGSVTRAKQDYQIACDFKFQPACDTIYKFTQQAQADVNDDGSVEQLLAKSLQKFKQKDWQAVEEYSTKVISIDINNARAYNNRAGARTELGRLSNALDDCNRAIQIDPEFGIAHNNCGYAYELMGQMHQATIAYEQACNLGVEESCGDYKRLSGAILAN